MKILYLHGLDSFLQDDRREVLQNFGDIYAPILNYLNTPNLFEKLLADYKTIDCVIGSSLGGLVAYYLAQKLQIPALLFNPALPFKNQLPFQTDFNKNYTQFMQVVIGIQDEVIDFQKSLSVLTADFSEKQNAEIHLLNTMKHSYPIEIFKTECDFFFKKISF